MRPASSTMQADFLVLGGGVAGFQAALKLAEEGSVLVVNKGKALVGSSQYAQGGVAAALGPSLDWRSHFQDTLKAGAGLCDREAVQVLVREGPRRVRELVTRGARFDRRAGRFLFAREAAHSQARVLRAKGDRTGEEIVRVFLAQARAHRRIRVLKGCFVLDLLVEDGICLGALACRERTGRTVVISAKATILATGGAGALYLRTTNPAVATGDGMAMAFRAGAVLEDMEFVQFHPTALCVPGAPAFLLSEALRGEGAILRNSQGVAFMKRYHTEAELAPRDVVARAVWMEMVRQGGKPVYLDLTHLDGGFLRKRFPMIYRTCLHYGFDLSRKPVPVSPAAHFMIGGVKTDLNGASSLRGLYAVGEVACTRVHGANRLGSNSLLEGLVFGYRAAVAARRYAARRKIGRAVVLGKGDPRERRLSHPEKVLRDIQSVMWEKVGVVRSEESLKEALEKLTRWHRLLSTAAPSRPATEAGNLVTVGLLVAAAALLRRRSLGVHFRSDDLQGPTRKDRGHRTLTRSDLEAVLRQTPEEVFPAPVR